METKPFCAGELADAKVMVIGHDPRLQRSNTQAQYAFFGDYYFRPIPRQRSELAKYRLAEKVFSCAAHMTSHRYTAEQLVLTNLCNKMLPRPPAKRTVLIPQEEAQEGIAAIRDILAHSQVELIFAMSEQVNYWLQRLGFYAPVPEFLRRAEPAPRGLLHEPPYYTPKQGSAFQLICGRRYTVGDAHLVPILHVKNWPLRGRFKRAYAQAYERLINGLKPQPSQAIRDAAHHNPGVRVT